MESNKAQNILMINIFWEHGQSAAKEDDFPKWLDL